MRRLTRHGIHCRNHECYEHVFEKVRLYEGCRHSMSPTVFMTITISPSKSWLYQDLGKRNRKGASNRDTQIEVSSPSDESTAKKVRACWDLRRKWKLPLSCTLRIVKVLSFWLEYNLSVTQCLAQSLSLWRSGPCAQTKLYIVAV